MEPADDCSIHIIVTNREIAQLGARQSEPDKTTAGMKARDEPVSFGVDTRVEAVNESRATSKRRAAKSCAVRLLMIASVAIHDTS